MRTNVKLGILGVVLVVLLVLSYSNHFENGFQFDDSHSIVSNAAIRDIRNVPTFFVDGTTSSSLPANQAYRPMATALSAIDYWIAGGLKPFYFHLSQFFWYMVQLVLVFLFFRRIFDLTHAHRLNPIIALGTTAFYGFHTANAETINYIGARTDSFSTLCVVAAFVLYQTPVTRKCQLHLLAMVLGIFTKQTAVMFAPLLVLYVALFEEKVFGRASRWSEYVRRFGVTLTKSGPALVAGTGLFLFNQLYMTPASTVSSNTGVGRFDYLVTQLHVITHYLKNFLLPVELSADPDFEIITAIDIRVVVGAAVVGGLLYAGIWILRFEKARPATFGILWFFVALAPTSSLVPLYQMANDHRTFFPYVGLSLSVGWLVGLLAIRLEGLPRARTVGRCAIAVVTLLVVGAHANGVRQRNEVWSSGESLWHDVTIKSPKNARGLMNYGLSQMEKGNYEVALDYYLRALDLWPRYPYLHINLGILKNATGHPEEAESYFKQGLAYGKTNPEAYNYYADFLDKQGRTEEARELLERGLEISPGHAYMKLRLERLGTSRPDRQIADLLKKIEQDPSAVNYVNLSLAYYKARRWGESIGACEKALAIEPGHRMARGNLQWARTRQEGS